MALNWYHYIFLKYTFIIYKYDIIYVYFIKSVKFKFFNLEPKVEIQLSADRKSRYDSVIAG